MRDQSLAGGKITVIHNFPIWLPQTQTWMYNQVRYLPPEVECHILCETTENLDQFHLPNIHCLSEAPRWRYYWDKGLRKFLLRRHLGFLVDQAKRHHAQVLHSHFGNVGWENIGAAKRVGMKHVVTFYGYDVNFLPQNYPIWRERYRRLFVHVDRVLCEGPSMAQCVMSLGCPEDKVRVHRLGIRVEEIKFEPRTWRSGQLLRVLIAASFQEKKGIPYALEALAQIQHEVPLEISIIGDANYNDPRSHIEKQKILATIKKYNLHEKTRLLGYQPHRVMLEEAYKHHVFLSPSVTAIDGDNEGGAPVTIIEMSASGMPVISSRHCDIPGVLQGGQPGLLAEERNIDELASKLRWLINNPKRWFAMLQAARTHIVSEFDARTQGYLLKETYNELIGDSHE